MQKEASDSDYYISLLPFNLFVLRTKCFGIMVFWSWSVAGIGVYGGSGGLEWCDVTIR